uniref:Metalloendopeptidase n=1 Tax=Timema douglasi TaxID=61478 RepID=A0A7R8VCR6_TIMDO|nr:unnamed protein product [Timema douglasi]
MIDAASFSVLKSSSCDVKLNKGVDGDMIKGASKNAIGVMSFPGQQFHKTYYQTKETGPVENKVTVSVQIPLKADISEHPSGKYFPESHHELQYLLQSPIGPNERQVENYKTDILFLTGELSKAFQIEQTQSSARKGRSPRSITEILSDGVSSDISRPDEGVNNAAVDESSFVFSGLTVPTTNSTFLQDYMSWGQGDLFEIDPIEGPYLEGDIILREHQNIMEERNLVNDPKRLWPGGVLYYDISSEFTPKQQAAIRDALDDLQRHTCVKFRPRTNQPSFIRVRNSGYGCASHVGYVSRPGPVDLYLSYPGCFHQFGTIQHEFLHALGFWHEHTRPDRDRYVRIIWQNILPGREANFESRTTQESQFEGLPYDYDSVMHYRSIAFSKDKMSVTILPYDNTAFWRMGQRKRYSYYDLAKLNRLYHCGPGYTGTK